MIIFKETIDPHAALFKKYLTECLRTHDFTRFKESELEEGVKDIWNFIKEMASNFALKIGDLVRAFKNKEIFKFFASFNFSFKNIVEAFKQVYSIAKTISGFIPQKTAKLLLKVKNNLPPDIQEALKNGVIKVDRFLKSKGRFGNIVFTCFMIWIFLNATIVGDVSYDFDASDIINAMNGKLTFERFFLGENGDFTNKDDSTSLGLEYLSLIILGKIGYGGILPYAQFSNGAFLSISLLQYLAQKLYLKISKVKNSDKDMDAAQSGVPAY
jgi:hypothetical protein